MAYEFSCFQEGCTFNVQADSKDEVVYLVKEHAQYAHDLEIERSAIESEVQVA
jgi:predicted small metal-binding protein